ncbi:MAG: DUF885 domain-containing protein [Thermoanaerobaculia bacterium]|nr:DUF885 domain-containing protein [Thermoanaerobaculia bacterium]
MSSGFRSLRPRAIIVFCVGLLLGLTWIASAETATERFHRLLDDHWEHGLKMNPLAATAVGRHEYDHLMPDASQAALAKGHETIQSFLERLDEIDREALEAQDRVSYDVFGWLLRSEFEDYEAGGYLLFLTAEWGFHVGLVTLGRDMPLADEEGYRDYLARLTAFPDYFEQQIGLLRLGLERGWTLPQVVMQGYDETIRAQVVDELTESVFWKPFESFPATVPATDHDALRRAGTEAVAAANSAYEVFLEFMTEEYIPGARRTVGAAQMPDGGREYYDARVRFYTTLPDLTADAIHRLGLEEVARIRADMDQIIADVRADGLWAGPGAGEGEFEAFLRFLRSDAQFYAATPEELLKQAAYLSKKMDGQLPSLFGRLPRQPYGVEPVPDYLAPKFTAGRYSPAPIGSTRSGEYWVNTYDLDSRPTYVLEALTLHEAVPGHHLQGALTQELEHLPPFRQQLYISAFGEGWGLYSERLGLEAGFYEDPFSDFGRLTYEMWRACRLVVDTGLHAMGWTRQQALDYLGSNTALSLHEVRTEIDRYISWPGQALSYKIGELEILELRARAEEELGARFDLRGFHDVLLSEGAVPLPVLERVVQEWIEASSK